MITNPQLSTINTFSNILTFGFARKTVSTFKSVSKTKWFSSTFFKCWYGIIYFDVVAYICRLCYIFQFFILLSVSIFIFHRWNLAHFTSWKILELCMGFTSYTTYCLNFQYFNIFLLFLILAIISINIFPTFRDHTVYIRVILWIWFSHHGSKEWMQRWHGIAIKGYTCFIITITGVIIIFTKDSTLDTQNKFHVAGGDYLIK